MIPGLTGKCEMVVKEEDLVSRLGDIPVNVLSTPRLIQLLENAAIEAIREHMPGDQVSLGAEIRVRHLSETPLVLRAQAMGFEAAATENLEFLPVCGSFPDPAASLIGPLQKPSEQVATNPLYSQSLLDWLNDRFTAALLP